MELTWAVLGLSGARVGQSWGPLWALLGSFGASWAVWGLSWAVLGSSWPSRGSLGDVTPGCLGAVGAPSQAVLGPSGGLLGQA